MRRIIKGIVNRTWKPFVEWYLRHPRNYRYEAISIRVEPGVFHPGFFFSTKLLIYFLKSIDLKGTRFLEMGSGSGLVSIFAAKRNAHVTAAEISPVSLACTKENAKRNHAEITVVESDLFRFIPAQQFDFIIVNPPYFKKSPATMGQHAWYCGENLEYFEQFFQQASSFVHMNSIIIMVLSDECDFNGIQVIAGTFHWKMELAMEKRTAWEKGYIFNIRPMKHEML